MLLVFFLVTSSMDADRGLPRRLPPADQQEQRQDINRSNVLQVEIGADDVVRIDGQPVSQRQLQQQVESFVASRQSDRHVIAVSADRQATYNAYFEMQTSVLAAYRSLRERMARQKYGHSFAVCTPAEREAILSRYPQRISETVADGQKGGRP